MLPGKIVLPVLGLAGAAGIAFSDQIASVDSASEAASPHLTGAQPFVERFATIDRERWNVSDGWYNGDYMVNDWRAHHAWADDGLTLMLAANRTEHADFSSGELQTIERFGHGYYEARMRAASGSGVITGFFTYIGPHWKKPWNEIDVEVLGSKPRSVQVTYFTDSGKLAETIPLPFDATQSFHVYGFDWQPDAIRWYVDGQLIHSADGKTVPLPYEKQKIMLSVWGSRTLADWAGPLDKNALPTRTVITCVAYSPSFETGRHCE